MKSLQDRKHDLILESELNRHALRLELQQMYLRVEQTRLSWQQNIWKWAAPVAGFFLARKLKKTSGLVAKGSVLLMALGKFWEFWRARRSKEPRT